MSIRDALAATIGGGVASCAPHATQRATSTEKRATPNATTAQRPADSPRDSSLDSATARATGAQLDSCAALFAAIHRCCDARGDDPQNHAGLIAECGRLPPRGQTDMREHFEQQAVTWERATGKAP